MDCVRPNIIRTDENRYIEVPCGSCILCRIARTREWCTRLQYENSCWKESVFITLTYDDEHLPVSNCGCPTLVKKDLQGFFKRLRSKFHEDAVIESHLRWPDLKASDPEFLMHVKDLVRKFKYFACGEYGDRFERCHFHAIIFGLSPSEISLFQDKWPFGFVSVGGVSPHSIQYVTGYVRKKMVKKDKSVEGFSCLHRAPEFQIQSQGLGLRFYDQNRERFRSSGSCYINGHTETLPRYFLKKDPGLKLALRFSEEKYHTREDNLKRARDILRARDPSKCILDELRKSAEIKARTERSKNELFTKGKL